MSDAPQKLRVLLAAFPSVELEIPHGNEALLLWAARRRQSSRSPSYYIGGERSEKKILFPDLCLFLGIVRKMLTVFSCHSIFFCGFLVFLLPVVNG